MLKSMIPPCLLCSLVVVSFETLGNVMGYTINSLPTAMPQHILVNVFSA